MQAECVEKMHIPLRLQHHLPPKPPQIVLQSTKPNAIPCRHAHKKRRKICDIFPDILSQNQIFCIFVAEFATIISIICRTKQAKAICIYMKETIGRDSIGMIRKYLFCKSK